MNFKPLLKNEQLLAILHKVLTNENTKNKISKVSINGESYAYNQYSLLIIMDIVIKYQIIINDEMYHQEFLNELERFIYNYKSHQELVLKGNELLINLVSKKLNINVDTTENKKEILKHIYSKYIVNGYCFHSFPSAFKKLVNEEGLNQKVDYRELEDLKKINYIFNNHNYKSIISKNLKARSQPICITDSPAMAYYYAFRSPEYLAEITSLSKYYKNVKSYDSNAFYEKNYEKCEENLISLCNHVKMTEKEKNTILKTFTKRWNKLNMSNSTPCIAFIKRNNLAKDSYSNIQEIIDSVDKIDLNILVSKITDSKYQIIRKYSDISPLDLMVVTMPSYREIKNNKFINDQKKKTKTCSNEIENAKINLLNYKSAYSYGNVNILALLGLLLITLGLTLSIIIKIIGG